VAERSAAASIAAGRPIAPRRSPDAADRPGLRRWPLGGAAGHSEARLAGWRLDSHVRRGLWIVLSVWTAAWMFLHVSSAGYSWRFFVLGADLLTSASPVAGGLHVYAAHPELQIGPLALLAAVPLIHLDAWHGRLCAVLLLSASGPLLLAYLVRVRERSGPVRDPLLLMTGLLVLPVWTEVAAHYAHLDDVLALAAIVGATGALRRGSAATTGLLLAAAADSKPWVVGCGLLLVVLPAGKRGQGLVAFSTGIALAWVPFLLADPRTLDLGHFTIPNVASSALNALGVHDPATPPWDRGAQLILGVAVAALAVRRGRWPAVLLAIVCARLLLDPATYKYYTSGLLLATALVDMYVRRRGFPMWTSAAALFYIVEDLLDPILPAHLLGALRASYCIIVLAALALPGAQASATDAPATSGGRHRRRWLPGTRRTVPERDERQDRRSATEISDLEQWEAFLADLDGTKPDPVIPRQRHHSPGRRVIHR
jgi:hypothetical protein